MRIVLIRSHHAGSAALIVLVLLAAMVALLLANNVVLSELSREINLTERRQLKRYGPAAVTRDQTVPRRTTHE